MDPNLSKLERLVAAYVRARQPNARQSDIAAAFEALRERIEHGELTYDAAVCRLQRELGGRTRMPIAFGDMARAVRDLDGGRLTPRERAFVKEMVALGFKRSPSSRQAAWLSALFDRLQRSAAA